MKNFVTHQIPCCISPNLSYLKCYAIYSTFWSHMKFHTICNISGFCTACSTFLSLQFVHHKQHYLGHHPYLLSPTIYIQYHLPSTIIYYLLSIRIIQQDIANLKLFDELLNHLTRVICRGVFAPKNRSRPKPKLYPSRDRDLIFIG